MVKYKRHFSILLMSLLGGLFVAYSFAVTVDGLIKFDIITYPAVLPIATMYGIVGGLIIAPVAFLSLRKKNIFIAVPMVVLLVAVLTACLNVLASPKVGLPGSLLATLLILFVWRRIGPADNHD